MKRNRYFILFLLALNGFAQTTPINQLDTKGKKTGYWKIYLDERAMPTDSANSYLFGYEFYDYGKPVMNIFVTEKNLTRYKIIYSGTLPTKGRPIPINDTLTWFDTKYGSEDLRILDVFENGYPTVFKEYSSGLIFQKIDFTKKYNNQPGSYYLESYYGTVIIKGKEKLKKYWCYKEKNKWEEFEIK